MNELRHTGERARRGAQARIAVLLLLALGGHGCGHASAPITRSTIGAETGPTAYVTTESTTTSGEEEQAERPSQQPAPVVATTPASVGAARYAPPPPAPIPQGAIESSSELYAAAPESGVQETAADSLATFSLDVDTASYTLMRRDLTAGRWPTPAGVRAEEYVNFFRYGDIRDVRQNGVPFGMRLESAPSHFASGNAQLLRVGVRAIDVDRAQRPPTNLVFLVDVSGSMQEANKLPLVQYALTTLVRTLRPEDTIGIVVYAGSDSVLLQPTPVANRDTILAAIAQLAAGGSTNGAAGIRTAYDLASQHLQRGGVNRVILCTDGDFNVGLTGSALVSLIEQERDRGITLTTLGFGSGNYNDRDMEQLADHGNGNYAYIDGTEEAKRVLQRDLESTLSVVASDVKVQVRFNPEVVQSYRLIGYDNRVLRDRDFTNDSVDAAEVGAGQTVTAYLEYRLRDGVVAGRDPRQLAQVAVRYKLPSEAQSRETHSAIAVREAGTSFDQASPQFRFGAAVAEFAQVLRGSQHAEGRPFAEIERIARASTWNQDADAVEFADLVHRASTVAN